MASVDIPKWLKSLPLAPEFRPTDTEFADPIAYISKIEKEASAFGICKVIPPLPKPSKRYVLSNLNRSLSTSRQSGFDVNVNDAASDLRNGVSKGKTDGHEAKAVFTTRQQELGQVGKRRDVDFNPQSAAQKQVWQSGEVYTLEQFESKSKAFNRSILGGIKEVSPQVIEALFWKANSDKPIYVEYANDVPGSGFGEPDRMLPCFHGCKRSRQYAQSHLGKSSYVQQDVNSVTNPNNGAVLEASGQNSCLFSELCKECADQPTSSSNETSQSTKRSVSHANGELEGTAGWKLSNSPWNLQVIARSAGSLTRFLLDDIPGVTSPMVYIGMLFSWFAWHVEDHELHSLNFLHLGSPKTWYAVPGDYAVSFEEVIRTQAYGGNVDHLAALKLIGEKTTLLSPALVVASGIPCCRLVQNPGEYVVTFPRAYHVGFSHGFNCGEAANFGTPQWLTVAKDAAVRRAAMDLLPMLSHQQLLYVLTMSFIPRVPRSLLPSVRSSRLKDRLKEERELLVKKAFLMDVLKENKLLNTLSERYPALHAVLWHPELLPSVRESMPQPDLTMDLMVNKDDELSVTSVKNSNQDDFCHQLTTDDETLNDICNSGYLSCDLKVDSGALPCVACGILGYPLMSVIQLSMKAATELFPAENLTKTGAAEIWQKGKSSHLHYFTKYAISATNNDETWDTYGLLRPRIFCLEHAVKIEELLRPIGGANMLVICHSDYQKIKVNAATVAEETRTVFNFKEVLLDSASKEELRLIDSAIEGEQSSDSQEDWTSKLGMNLRYSIKVKTSCPSKKVGVHYTNYLFSVIAPPDSTISSIKWCSKKSRTRRESNNRKHTKSCAIHSKKDETIYESGRNMKRKEKVFLKYSRRKSTAMSRDSQAKHASAFNVDCLPEETSFNGGESSAFEQEVSGVTYVRNVDADVEELYTKHCVVQCKGAEMVEMNQKCATNVGHTDPLYSKHPVTMLQVNSSFANKFSCEATVLIKASISTSGDSVLQGETRLEKKSSNVNDNLAADNCYSLSAIGMQAIEKPGSFMDNNFKGDSDSIEKANVLMTMGSVEIPGNKQHILSISNISDSAFHSLDAEITGSSVLGKACARFEVHNHAASNVPEIQRDNENYEYDNSTCIKSTTTLGVNMLTLPKENHKDYCEIITQACSLQVNSKQDVDRANAKLSPSSRRKRARKVDQAEVDNDFVRSPCEGLRPRISRKDLTCKSSSNMSSVTEQKPPRKMIKKCLGSSITQIEVMKGKGSYKCSLECCSMCFKTKAELSLHKRNKCHHEECGKRFRSHKYVVLHQRVHDDKRPLKCTWKGCRMTFKWSWARTEHLRLHTGERPYECKIEGCGQTFRFVSDFSRHRRKTGHYINVVD